MEEEIEDSNLLTVKCLIVDDRDENLLALSALLRGPGVEVLEARSGPEALELLLVHDVALALLDVQMPEMDGFELAELMRGSERTHDVPLIFVTAGTRDQHRVFKGYERGAVDFLYKPIDPQILRNKAGVFFQLHRQKQLLARELGERTKTLQMNEMFMAVLGHDLRNPLSAIVTSAAVLQRSPEDGVRRAAERIATSSRRMSRMIDDMLDLARVRQGGGVVLARTQGDFVDPVRRAVQEVQASFPDRPPTVVHAQGDMAGEWDADRIAQTSGNLVANALEHGVPERPVRVEIDGSQPERVVMRVVNQGEIPEHVLPHLFEPFQSGRRLSGRGEGLGLGLYIVRQIALAHGGSVRAECGGDGSTCFVVDLPRHGSPPSA